MQISHPSFMLKFGAREADDKGYTHSLEVAGKNILTKWGVEFSDGDSYFIQGLKSISTNKIIELHQTKNKTNIVIEVQLSKSKIHIQGEEVFEPTRITRTYIFTPDKDTHFMDISISQAFDEKVLSHFEIDGKTFEFDNGERNHQYETDNARLIGKEFDIEIAFESNTKDTGFTQVVYGRASSKKGWVVHTRLFPKEIVKKAIMWCNNMWNKRVPFSDALSKIAPLVDYLWYAGEKPSLAKRKTYGFVSYGLALAKKNVPIRMTQTMTLKPKK